MKLLNKRFKIVNNFYISKEINIHLNFIISLK